MYNTYSENDAAPLPMCFFIASYLNNNNNNDAEGFLSLCWFVVTKTYGFVHNIQDSILLYLVAEY
jgi:hypothetical protein